MAAGFTPAVLRLIGRATTLLVTALICMPSGRANPSGGTVRHGSATIVQNGNQLTINQVSGLAILDWNSFSIAHGETTKFNQPGSTSIALNRVNGGTQSLINGTLEANGGVILINPAGIMVGSSGVVNVNSFIASTRDVTDNDFLSGKSMKFQGNSEASIQNLGTIHAESGDIYLIAHSIINSGTLSAKKGTVGLAAANEVLLQPAGDEKLSILSQEASGGKIVNSGTIHAVAAEIKAAGNPYAVAINLDGIIETHAHPTSGASPKVTIRATQGDIAVGGGAKITANGESAAGKVIIQTVGSLEIGGTILATSSAATGGTINLLGKNIHLDSTTVVDASGFLGGGKIFVGGDYQGGKNATVHYSDKALPTAQTLQVDQGSKLSADATGKGNGGVIIQWSDGTTVSSGSVSVQGGSLGGNGGFAEISGKQNLGFNGSVNLSAPKGTAGQVLFDPTWLQITDGPDSIDWSSLLPTMSSASSFSSGENMNVANIQNITGGTITLEANFISLEDCNGNNRATITLSPNVNLILIAKPDGSTPGYIYMPGTADGPSYSRSSITASGTGFVTLDASDNSTLNMHGLITTASGPITLLSQGNIDLSGGTLTSASGSINVQSSAGSITGNNTAISTSGAGGISLNAVTGMSLTATTMQSTSGNVQLTSSGALDLYSLATPGNLPTSAQGSLINSVSGSISLNASGDIYMGGSSLSSQTGNISLASSAGKISLVSDYYFPDGITPSLIPSTIVANGGNISLSGSAGIALKGALIENTSGGITLVSSAPSSVIDIGSRQYAATATDFQANITDTATAGSAISSGSGSTIVSGWGLNLENNSSIITSGSGLVQMYAAQDLNLGGSIQTDNGYIQLRAQNGNVNFTPGSSIQQTYGYIDIWSDYGSILGSTHISSVQSGININAYGYTYTPGSTLGTIDLSGEIKTGANGVVGGGGIVVNARNTLTFNGILKTAYGDINLGAGNSMTLGDSISSTSVSTANNSINLSSPMIQLNGTALSAPNGSISINNGNQMILTGDTLASITSSSGNIFNNLRASQINLYANSIFLSDPNGDHPSSISLQAYESLFVAGTSITLPFGSSIQSGNGWVQMYANQDLNLGGSIQTDNGYIQLHARNGNINFTPGSSIQQGYGYMDIWTDYGSILGSSHINSVSSGININAYGYSYTPGTTLGTIDLTGEIKTGLNGVSSGGSIHLNARNTLTFNGLLNSVGGDINLNGNQGITLGSTDQSTSVSTANNSINLSSPMIQLNGTTLSSPSGSISINNGNQLILTGDTLATITSSSGNIFNNLSASQISFYANSVSLSDPNGHNPTAVTLPSNESIFFQANNGNLLMPAGSSITTSGNGSVQLYAAQDLDLAGSIQTDQGYIGLHTWVGNINFTAGSAIQQNNGAIQIWADNGSITGTTSIHTDSGSLQLWANNSINGLVDLSGSISAGNSISLSAGNNLSFNGALSSSSSINLSSGNNLSFNGAITSVGNSISLSGGNGMTLGDSISSTSVSTANNSINLSSPMIQLNGTGLSAPNGSISINNGNQLILTGDTLATITSSSGNIFNNLSASQISFYANSVSLSDPNGHNPTAITLPPNESIFFQANNGNLLMPFGSSITASGNGQVRLYASQNLTLGGTILTDQGYIGLYSWGGIINFTAGSSVQQNNAQIQIWSDNGSITGTTSIHTDSGSLQLWANNSINGLVDLSGSISAGNSISLSAGNNLSFNGTVNSSGNNISFYSPTSITLGNLDAVTSISTPNNLQLNAPALAFINSPELTVGSLSGAFGSINSSSVRFVSSTAFTKSYDGTPNILLSPGDFAVNSLNNGYTADILSVNGSYNSPDVDSASSINIHSVLLQLNGQISINGSFGLGINNLSVAGTITPAYLIPYLSGSPTTVHKVYDGTTTANVFESLIGLSGTFFNNDVVGIQSGYAASYATPNVGSGMNVTVSGLALNNPNYKLVDGGGNLTTSISGNIGTITPATVTASLIGTTTKTYDTTTMASLSSGNYQLSGVLGNDVVTLNNPGTGSYASANVGNGITVSVGGLSLVGNGLGNYVLGNANNSVSGNIGTITPATVTASLSGMTTKTYDTTTMASLSSGNYQLSGVLGNDVVTFNNPGTGSYASANVGNGITVSVGGLSLVGNGLGNYVLGNANNSVSGNIGTITPATVTASLIGTVNKQYNGDAVAKISPANYILNGVLGLDLGNVRLNNPVTGTYDNANAGAGINVTVSGLALTGSAANNYQLASTTINATIGSITALPPPPPPPATVGTGNSLAITGVINTPDFRRMVQAAVPPPPPPAAAGPAGPAIGGSFGSAGPGGVGGGFSPASGDSLASGAPAPPPASGSPGQGGSGAPDPNSPPPAANGAPVADNGSASAPGGSAPTANGAPAAANGTAAGGASGGGGVAGGPAGSGASPSASSHSGGVAGNTSGSSSPGQAPVHLPASVVAATRLNSPVINGNSAAAAFNRLNPTISAGEGVVEESSSSSGAAAQSQGASPVNQSRASSRFGGVGSDSTPGGDLNSMVQVFAL